MPLYRFILMSTPTRADTGANYAGCSPNSTHLCDPQGFDGPDAMQHAVAYATAHNEIPVQVISQQEAFAMIAGSTPITQDRVLSQGLFGGMSATTLLLLGLGAIFLVPRLFK